MTSLNEFESLDEEVKELLQNYKFKRATTYEPCTLKNYKECLIGLGEELGLLNINYVFNPYIDLENNTLRPEALVNLVNAIWMLLHYHKNAAEKTERLEEQNHKLEQNNKHLNAIIGKLKEKLNYEKSEARACVASAQRMSDRSDEVLQNLSETRAKLLQTTKQKETTEKALRNAITRLKQENEKLMDRLKNKSGTYTSCSEVCDTTLLQLKDRERKQRTIIAQLQANNQDLLQQILAMKEDLILSGIQDFKFDQRKK